MYGIDHEVAALFFDRAVGTFGRSLEAELERAGSDAKSETMANGARMRVLNKWLSQDSKPIPGTFREPPRL